MPSTRKKTTKAGAVFYEIRVSRGRDKTYLTRRWYPPEGWSQKAIDRELSKVAAEFEREAQAGEVISRAEKRQQEAQEAAEAAKILTMRQYSERVFMPTITITSTKRPETATRGTWINGYFQHWETRNSRRSPAPSSPPCWWICRSRKKQTLQWSRYTRS